MKRWKLFLFLLVVAILAYASGHRVGSKDGFRDGHVRGYWLGRDIERYLRERIKEDGCYIYTLDTVIEVKTNTVIEVKTKERL